MPKPIVLQLGGPFRYNLEQYAEFTKTFDVKVNDKLDRKSFKQALKSGYFGQIYAIYRPYWNDGDQMGRWDEELINLLPKSCKIIAMAGAGFDWMDIDCLSARGIVYCNGGGSPTESVGDSAIYHILSTFRNFAWSFKSCLTGDVETFKKAHNECVFTARNPRNHTLGIIGMGKIGYRIAEKAFFGLDMNIVYFDLFQKPKHLEDRLKATFFKNIDDMLPQCDCVVLATPFFKEKFVNKDVFNKMKKGSRFVNIARGKLLDEDDLVAALDSGHIFSAGLDVFYNEPAIHPKLIENKRVSLTAHNGGGTVDTWIGFEKLGMDNIAGFYKNQKALSPVNLHLIKKAKL